MATIMERNALTWVTLALCLLSARSGLALHGIDTSVCDPNVLKQAAAQNPQGPPRPQLDPQFTVRIECNMVDGNYSTDVREYFDATNNRGAVHQWEDDDYTRVIYKYKEDRVYVINYNDGTNPPSCQVGRLSNSTSRFLLGENKLPNGTQHIYSAAQALRFGGNITEVYRGIKTVKGTQVNAWESCLYWDFLDSTMSVMWYFTTPDWTSTTLLQEPVRANVSGIRWVNSTFSYHFYHLYDFTDYRPQVLGADAFETPDSIFCNDPVSQKGLPNITNYFSFSAEIITPLNSYIDWIKEYYDDTTHLVRFDFRAQPGSNSQYGYNRLIRVHDFNTGVAYIIDSELGNCSVTPIPNSGFDALSTDPAHVRIRTKQEFFYFDKVQYTYVGQRQARGIDCDVWAAQRTDWPSTDAGITTLWEWYFATDLWMASIGNQFEIGNVPVMLMVTSVGNDIDIQYNMYGYDEDQPAIWTFDISNCYNFTHRKDVTFKLPGDFKKDVMSNEELFKYFVMLSISGYCAISPLRVSNLQFDYDSSDQIVVTFSMLDVAPPGIGDVMMTVKETPLDTAYQLLNDVINRGDFVVKVDTTTFANLGSVVAQPYSVSGTTVYEIQGSPSTGSYGAGAMAGIAIGMIILGLLLGFAAMFGVYKLRGGTFTSGPSTAAGFTPKTFNNEPEATSA